ncbi:MAG: ATP-binding protein, partial [Alphaproteobacteria bacterium]|nr:ATP-binding protein [Alphaproteobacteria bacterium]
KTPLAVMMSEANRLQAAGSDGSLLLEQCRKMRRQIDYELAKARAAASHASLGIAAPVAPAIGAVVSALERLYLDKPVRFDVDIADPDSIVACDREDLEEILGNLVDNAAKWSHGHVLVAARPAAAGRLRLTVEDDGPGMPIADRERVFRAGERLDEQVPGTGLGLAIVRDIAELYGGAAWIEDGALGGIRACVELPAVPPAGHQE